METFRFNSENKNWDTNNHPWDGLVSIFLSTHAMTINKTGRVHLTSLAQLITFIKYFIWIERDILLMRKNGLRMVYIILYSKAYNLPKMDF